MKNMLRMFGFAGALGFGCVALAEDNKADTVSASEESIQVVCPVNTDKNCENCDTTTSATENKNGNATVQPTESNSENK